MYDCTLLTGETLGVNISDRTCVNAQAQHRPKPDPASQKTIENMYEIIIIFFFLGGMVLYF